MSIAKAHRISAAAPDDVSEIEVAIGAKRIDPEHAPLGHYRSAKNSLTTFAAPCSSRFTWSPRGKRTMRLGSSASANSRSPNEMGTTRSRRHAPDALVRAERIPHQPARRRERIGSGADVCGGRERRVEDHSCDRALSGERDGHTAAPSDSPNSTMRSAGYRALAKS
jgi:hypothetical protein